MLDGLMLFFTLSGAWAADLDDHDRAVVMAPQATLVPVGALQPTNAALAQRSRNLRRSGVVLSVVGLPLAVTGLGLGLAGLFDDDPVREMTAAVLLLGGVGSFVAGPPLILAGGYAARRLVRRAGGTPRARGLEVLAWVAWALTPVTLLSYPVAVGAALGFVAANLREAEGLGRPDEASPGPTVSVLPLAVSGGRGSGLRVEVGF